MKYVIFFSSSYGYNILHIRKKEQDTYVLLYSFMASLIFSDMMSAKEVSPNNLAKIIPSWSAFSDNHEFPL